MGFSNSVNLMGVVQRSYLFCSDPSAQRSAVCYNPYRPDDPIVPHYLNLSERFHDMSSFGTNGTPHVHCTRGRARYADVKPRG